MTYPGDMHARIGLNKCIEALKRIQMLWPSAWRALELLQGSKAYQQDAGPIVANRLDRPKRVAEHALDERDRIEVPRIQTGDQLYRPAAQAQAQAFASPVSPAHDATQSQSQNPSQSQAYAGDAGGALAFGAPPGAAGGAGGPEPSPSSYLPPFDRWSDAALPQFTANLSTSVLPQQYSTGLVDERMAAGMGGSGARGGPGGGADRASARYPQYWNDYSTIGQMETAYGVAVPGMADLSQHHHVQGVQPEQVYSYDLFGEFLLRFRFFHARYFRRMLAID